MPRVIIDNMQSKTIDRLKKNENLLEVILDEIDWMHACGAKGRCTTCKAIIVSGMDKLHPMNDAELKFYNLHRLKSNERLACQVSLTTDLNIRVADENKLPHITYSS